MRSVRVIFMVLGLCVFNVSFFCFAYEITWQDIGRGNKDFSAVLIASDNPSVIFAAANNAVLKSEDAGSVWKRVLLVRGQNQRVNFLLIDSKDRNLIYAATGNGLFLSSNRGKDWRRIFKGKNFLENQCLTVAVTASAIFLGTKSGLFISKDKGRGWHKESGKIGNSQILSIACNMKEPDCIYVVSIYGVFKTHEAGKTWESIFAAHPVENINEPNDVPEDLDEPERFLDVKYVSIDPNNLNFIYVATDGGVYESRDKGKSWSLLTSYGLLSKDVKFLLTSLKSAVYAVTKSGIFEHTLERWHELSLGLMAVDIRFLAKDDQGNLYSACDNGLFRGLAQMGTDASLGISPGSNKNNVLERYSKDEPRISDVREAAIKYAEVDPEKITRWRKQASKKAILPRVSIGMDRDRNKTASSNVWGTYGTSSSSGKYFIGPDDETKDKNQGWDVSLTWELGDLIWSDDQVSIDVRSRLLVELRNNVLDEVTKLYFERIRVRMELDNLAIEDKGKRFEKELRFQELTSSLDALTGNYFSQHLITKV